MGTVFRAPAMAIYAIGGLWGLFICLSIVHEVGGFFLTLVALVLAPAVLYLAPWYAAFFQHDWFPVILIYGTSIVAGTLYFIGDTIDNNAKR